MPSDGDDSSGDELGDMELRIHPGPIHVRANAEVMMVNAGAARVQPVAQGGHPGKAPPPVHQLRPQQVVVMNAPAITGGVPVKAPPAQGLPLGPPPGVHTVKAQPSQAEHAG